MSIVPVKIADIIEVVKIVILKIILNIVPKQKGAQHDLTVKWYSRFRQESARCRTVVPSSPGWSSGDL